MNYCSTVISAQKKLQKPHLLLILIATAASRESFLEFYDQGSHKFINFSNKKLLIKVSKILFQFLPLSVKRLIDNFNFFAIKFGQITVVRWR